MLVTIVGARNSIFHQSGAAVNNLPLVLQHMGSTLKQLEADAWEWPDYLAVPGPRRTPHHRGSVSTAPDFALAQAGRARRLQMTLVNTAHCVCL